MKNPFLVLIILSFFNVTFVFGQDVIVEGIIGDYPIEVVFEKSDYETGEVEGKYRYKNKESYLSLKGEVYEDVLWLEESYKEEVTGQFFLKIEEDELKGKWVGNGKYYAVSISLNSEVIKKLKYKSLADRSKKVSDGISGTYKCEDYYVNEWFFSEEKPLLEVGFSGGTTVLDMPHPDSIYFQTEVVCGPTYHIAYASGVAIKVRENEFLCIYNTYEGDTCKIEITTTQKGASVRAFYSGEVCEFGARAYLDHDFLKVSEDTEFEEP